MEASRMSLFARTPRGSIRRTICRTSRSVQSPGYRIGIVVGDTASASLPRSLLDCSFDCTPRVATHAPSPGGFSYDPSTYKWIELPNNFYLNRTVDVTVRD